MSFFRNKNLIKNILFTLSRQVGSGILNIVILIAIARLYGAEINGIYNLIILIPMMLSTFLIVGIPSSIVYYININDFTPYSAWKNLKPILFKIIFFGIFFGIGLTLLLRNYLFYQIDIRLLLLGVLIFPFILMVSVISSFFQAIKDFKTFNLIVLIQPTVLLVLVFGFYFIENNSIFYLLLSFLLSYLIIFFISYKILLKKIYSKTELLIAPDFNNKIIKYGIKSHLSNIVAFVNYKADILMVGALMGPISVGIYMVSIQLSERLWILSQAVSSILLPTLTSMKNEKVNRTELTSLMTRWVLFITLIGSIFLAILSYYLIEYIFGLEFRSSFIPLLVLLPGTILGAASRILANDLAAIGKPELNFYTALLIFVVNLLGNAILIPLYGLIGASIATTVAYSLNFILRLYIHHKFTGSSIKDNIFLRKSEFVFIVHFLKKRFG